MDREVHLSKKRNVKVCKKSKEKKINKRLLQNNLSKLRIGIKC